MISWLGSPFLAPWRPSRKPPREIFWRETERRCPSTSPCLASQLANCAVRLTHQAMTRRNRRCSSYRSVVVPSVPLALIGLATALACVGGAACCPLSSRNDRFSPLSCTKRAHASHASHASLPPATATFDTAASTTTFLGGSNYRIDHRHGSSYGNKAASSSPNPSADEVIDSLVKLLLSQKQSEQDHVDRQGVEVEEARLWKRLGKLRLDAGEYAEAARTFRYGSKRCPSDQGLRHHCRVHDAFHGDGGGNDKDDKAAPIKVPDPMSIPAGDDDLFLLLDVPPDSVPSNILQFSGQTEVTPSLTRIICASKQPILTKEACRFLIQLTKDAAAKRGGWTTDRHVHAPTCDIPAFELDPSAVRWTRRGFHSVLLPLVASTLPSELGLSATNLRIQDCFVVRYDGREEDQGRSSDGDNGPGFASLKPHEDESLVSLTIALNDMSDYDGGGLFIASTGDLLNGDAGTVLSFAGGLVHGGYPVTSGTRWILTVFLYVDKNLSGREPGYTIDAIEGAVRE